MKYKILFSILFCYTIVAKAQVGIGTTSPNASAMLDITANNKGVLIPRVTTTQRTDDITSPALGLLVYDTTTQSFWHYNSTKWVEGSGKAHKFVDGTTTKADAVFTAGKVGIGTEDPQETLHVIGNILASSSTTPDYVFQNYYKTSYSLKKEYQFLSLDEIETFVINNNHLPGVPSYKEIKKQGGITLNRATEINLEKIEELFLHTIEQQKKINQQEKELKELKVVLQLLQTKVNQLTKDE